MKEIASILNHYKTFMSIVPPGHVNRHACVLATLIATRLSLPYSETACSAKFVHSAIAFLSDIKIYVL